MKYFYSAAAMGYGVGRAWHKLFTFPNFPRVTKTLTRYPNKGYPYAVVRVGNTIYNHVKHHNMGFYQWLGWISQNCTIKDTENIIVSIAGTDQEIREMIFALDTFYIRGIQLSFSCPNVCDLKNKYIPQSKHPIYLKLNYLQDPYQYDLDRIAGINVNSVPCWFGGMSGKGAQKFNWPFIKKFNEEGLDVAGSSFLNREDIKYLEEYCGCKRIGVGSTILLKPKLVESLI